MITVMVTNVLSPQEEPLDLPEMDFLSDDNNTQSDFSGLGEVNPTGDDPLPLPEFNWRR